MRQTSYRKTKWYWPEIHRYCGCCNLRTGIYIRTVISMIISGISLSSNCVVLFYMLRASSHFYQSEYQESEERFQIPDFTALSMDKAILAYKILFGYYVAWIVFKFAYAILLFVMIYGVFTKKPKILKAFLYIVIPYWIFDVIVSSLGAIFSNFWLKAVLVVALLSEGYNLLAISTEYKVITGKSMIVQDLSSVDVETTTECGNDSTTSIASSDNSEPNNQRHCSTCTCLLTPETESNRIEDNPSTLSSENENLSSMERPKILNFKETSIIFDQDQMIDLNSPVLVECRNPTLESCLAYEESSATMKKNMDEPVIYDDSQLNVGTSPIIEYRPFAAVNQNEINR